MKTFVVIAISLLSFTQVSAPAQSAPTSTQAPPAAHESTTISPSLAANYGKIPLSFEANQGQSDPQVRFLSRGQGYSLFLTDSTAVLALTKNDTAAKKPSDSSGPVERDVIRMELNGASQGVRVVGGAELPGKANYLIGNDPTKWHSNVATYAQVKYSGVYPGIDLIYYGNQQQLEYDFVVAPHADTKPLRLHFAGAESVALTGDGELRVVARGGEIAFHRPVVYQAHDGVRQPVEGRFAVIAKNTVTFKLGHYDHGQPLVIDPVLAYSTYLEANGYPGNISMAIDTQGNAYVTGHGQVPVSSPIGGGGLQPSSSSSIKPLDDYVPPVDYSGAFIIKVNPAGSAVVYSTFIGGTYGATYPLGIAVDYTGHAYVTGYTQSNTFPVSPGAYQAVDPNTSNYVSGFLAKLNYAGSALIYSTYLTGNSGGDYPQAIAVDNAGEAFVAGVASSREFPVSANAFQTVSKGQNAFIAKMNPTGTKLVYSTYLGGSGETGDPSQYYNHAETPYAIAVDSSGNVYVAGSTGSPDFPVTPNAFQKVKATATYAGALTGFVTKLNATGTALVYSSYLGGMGGTQLGDIVNGIALDSSGHAYVTGVTRSRDFPTTAGAFQKTNSFRKAFVSKFSIDGSSLAYSTYLGASSGETGQAIAVDQAGHAFVTGATASANFPVTVDAYQSTNKTTGPATNVFLTEFNPQGTGLLYSSYLGGTARGGGSPGDEGFSVAVDALGNAYFAGETFSTDFPATVGAFKSQTVSTAPFLAKLVFNGQTTATLAADNNPVNVGTEVHFTAHVTSTAGGALTTGSVTFIANGQIAAHVNLDGAGDAVYSTTSLPIGGNTITASYLGSPTLYAASTSSLTENVTGGQVAAPVFNPPGGSYQLNGVQVYLSSPTPGATLHYTTDGSVPSAASTTYTNSLYLANQTVKAIAVQGSNTASPVSQATYTLVVPGTPTSTVLTSSANPSMQGQAVTFIATVKAHDATPTGVVLFRHGVDTIGTATLTHGTASIVVSDLTPYGHDITATYQGNSTYLTSRSSVVKQYVNPAP